MTIEKTDIFIEHDIIVDGMENKKNDNRRSNHIW